MGHSRATAIRAARSLATCTLLNQREAHSTCFNKLARTFSAQVEVLRKHRTGGKQTVVVQHVNVADGRQAIVGHVEPAAKAFMRWKVEPATTQKPRTKIVLPRHSDCDAAL